MWSIVLPAGISSSIQNERDSSGRNKALLIASLKESLIETALKPMEYQHPSLAS